MKTTRIDGAAIVRETAKAYFLNIPGCHSAAWIAKSMMSNASVSLEHYNDGSKPGRYLDADIPVWLWNKLPLNDGPVPMATKPW